MRAIIMAGGKGIRLKPYTKTIPKPLMPIGDETPILEIIIKQLAKSGFDHITIAVSHMAQLIMAFFGDGARWGVKIDYSIEDKPLSTIAPITLIPNLEDHFLVMNGDILCNLDYKSFYDHHVSRDNDVTVAVYNRNVKIDFGVLKFNENNLITDFSEKPIYHFDVSMGVYCLSRRVIEMLPRNLPYGFDNLMTDGIRNSNKMEVKSFDGFWLDIGRPDDYDYANEHSREILEKMGINN